MLQSDLTYRRCVIPFALFCLLAGMICLSFALFRVPITSPFPFVRSETGNQVILGILSLWCLAIGGGLLMRHLWGWYLLLSYLIFGVFIVPLSIVLDRNWPGDRTIWFFGTPINAAIGVGLYLCMRSAFDARRVDK